MRGGMNPFSIGLCVVASVLTGRVEERQREIDKD